MKVKMEMDLTPQEALELFAGNVDSLQKAMLKMFESQVRQNAGKESDVMEFWRSMAQKSQEMFDAYNRAGESPGGDNKKR